MTNFNRLTISDVRHETPDAVSLAFHVPEDLQDYYKFKAGQHVILRKEIDGEDVRRTYSLCSLPGSDELRVAIRGISGGAFSSFANGELEPGFDLQVSKPIGGFFYEPETGRNTYVGFAAGSGITPVISILKSVLDCEPDSKFVLFYSNRDRANTIFLEDLMALKNRYMDRLSLYFFMSRQAVDGALFNGRINREACDTLLSSGLCPKDARRYYVCGPGDMMDDVHGALDTAGVEKTNVKSERFYAGPSQSKNPPRSSRSLPPALSRLSPTGRNRNWLICKGRAVFSTPPSPPDLILALLARAAFAPPAAPKS